MQPLQRMRSISNRQPVIAASSSASSGPTVGILNVQTGERGSGSLNVENKSSALLNTVEV